MKQYEPLKMKKIKFHVLSIAIIIYTLIFIAEGCQFYPPGEYLKFIRVAENLPLESEIFTLEVHPRSHLKIMPVDKEEDAKFFSYKDINATHISVILLQSLENLVDSQLPKNLLKFRFICDYVDGVNSPTSSHLSVTVYVEDVNDHTPEFIGIPYEVRVDEFALPGATIFHGIRAIDGDKPNTPNSDIHYAIVKGNEDRKFSLESSHRTALILRKSLDYDAGDRNFSLVITATDRGTPARSSSTTVTVSVDDHDDLGPKFSQETYRARIEESYRVTEGAIHQEIHMTPAIYAQDQDEGIKTAVKYSIVSGNERGLFQIDPRNGSLFLERPIDLDSELGLTNNSFTLQIHASQVDNPLKYTSARVQIEIVDVNDNFPEFEVDFYNISIVENLPSGFSVLQVVAHDRDQAGNSDFNYELDDPSGAFAVDAKSGWLTVRDERVLDRERRSSIVMRVLAVEKTPSVVSDRNSTSSVEVQVTLLDANDNNPIFVPSNVYEFVARTDAKVGSHVGQVQALDSDLGRNGIVRYRIQQTDNFTVSVIPFTVDPMTGLISVTVSPLVEGRHAIFIEAMDQPANPSERRFSLAIVTVDVLHPGSVRDLTPDFVGAPYEFWVGANVPIGTSVGQIRINNAAQKRSNITYDLLHSYHEGVPFAVEEQSGTITVIDEIERYTKRSYEFEGVVMNNRDLTLITNVSIHVVDVNDKQGLFTKGMTRAPLVFHVLENSPNAFIGQVLPHNGTNTTKNVRFLIANQRDVPDIAITEDGDLYTLRGLDREAKANHSITVIAETVRGLGIFQVNVVVNDVNDNPTLFNSDFYEGHLLENSAPGTEVILANRVSTHDADSPLNTNTSLALQGEGSELFALDSSGRVFFIGSPRQSSLDREEKSAYMLQIVADDHVHSKAVVPLLITIDDENDNAPVFAQMIVSPDHGITVSEDVLISKGDKDRHSPVLLVPENVTIGTVILRLFGQDKDASDNAEITYRIANETIYPAYQQSSSNSRFYFIVNPKSGALSVARALPAGHKIHLDVVASDRDNLTDHVMVKLAIADVNDHAPAFRKSWYSFNVPEGIYQRREIGSVTAEDLDMDENARITYKINPTTWKHQNLTFDIGAGSGVLMVTGDLDRETCDNYQITVIAEDNGKVALSSSVDVEIHVGDVNDNAPQFYGFAELQEMPNGQLVAIYFTSVAENTPIGTVIHRMHVNDSDFIGNGNGLIFFDLRHSFGEKQYFSIDNKDGAITTVSRLNYEIQELHNVTIIARDLGSPSLSSTAILQVRVLPVDMPRTEISDKPVFQHRYYEVEVEENSHVPMNLLHLNISDRYQGQPMKFSMVSNDSEIQIRFAINSNNGSLMLLKSLDRELRSEYELKVKAEKMAVARALPTLIYPMDEQRLGDLDINEAKIVVRVKDLNDNAPKFKTKGRPLLTAIPASINYGHEIIKVEAEDADEGINGQVRYQILGQEDALRFVIDPVSGQVRSAGSFSRDAGRVFGFDVKATDLAGADNGRSSIANVFVYVVDDKKQVVIVMGRKPIDIEDQVDDISRVLQNVTGLDVRVRKLEPHIEKNLIDMDSTDLYLYAVDPDLNIMIDMETLHNVFRKKTPEIKDELEQYRVLEITGSTPKLRERGYLLSSLEIGVLALGCVVLVGALVTIFSIACIRRKKGRGSGVSMFPPVGFALAEPTTTLRKPAALFPTFVDGLRYDPEPFVGDSRRLSVCEHDSSCIHHSRGSRSCGASKRMSKRVTSGCLETSVQSLHSSGQDSGIVARACQCGHSSTPSSADSSNGYEDSLKSLHHAELARTPGLESDSRQVTSLRGSKHRLHSFSNGESIYARDTSLKREMRYRTNMEKKQGPTELHVSRTMIRERPSKDEFSQNITRFNGNRGSSHSLFW